MSEPIVTTVPAHGWFAIFEDKWGSTEKHLEIKYYPVLFWKMTYKDNGTSVEAVILDKCQCPALLNSHAADFMAFYHKEHSSLSSSDKDTITKLYLDKHERMTITWTISSGNFSCSNNKG